MAAMGTATGHEPAADADDGTVGPFASAIITLTVAAVLLSIVVFVAGPVWSTARQADPIIEQLASEHDGPMSYEDWYTHREARAIFCGHPDGTEPDNRFGRFVDGGQLYWPLLMLKTFGGLAVSLLAFGAAAATPRNRRRTLQALAGATAVSLVAPLILYSDTINAVSNIVE